MDERRHAMNRLFFPLLLALSMAGLPAYAEHQHQEQHQHGDADAGAPRATDAGGEQKCDKMGGMGKGGGMKHGMGGMGGGGGMKHDMGGKGKDDDMGEKHEAMEARMRTLEKRVDLLQAVVEKLLAQ
jgi:hypothetical protein